MWKANKRWLKCSPGLGKIPSFIFFFFFHVFPTALGPFTQQTLLSTYVASIRLGSAGSILINEIWHVPWRNNKQIYEASHILWRSSTEFWSWVSSLLCLPYCPCDLFSFVPLLYLVHISIITFFTTYCIYLIMPLAPENSASRWPCHTNIPIHNVNSQFTHSHIHNG